MGEGVTAFLGTTRRPASARFAHHGPLLRAFEFWPHLVGSDCGGISGLTESSIAVRRAKWHIRSMATAIQVAQFLVQLGSAESEPELLTNMRLQKLLYYVQGWSVANRGKPMFSERIEAWPYGPVVPPVYGLLKKYGGGQIPADQGSKKGLTPEETEFISQVWNTYKRFSAIALDEMTHAEPPWRDARAALPPEAPSNSRITQESMRQYFASL